MGMGIMEKEMVNNKKGQIDFKSDLFLFKF